jgi:hypothetical protein
MDGARPRISGMNALRGALLAAVIFLAGCGSSDDKSTQAPVQTNGSLVSYTRTGGVGGIDEHLRIDPDGAATLSYGEPTNTSRTFQLTQTELQHMNSLLAAAGIGSAPNPQPTGCADCFVYTVETGGHTYTYDDSTPPPAAVGDLTSGLGDLAQAHQPAAAGYIKGG